MIRPFERIISEMMTGGVHRRARYNETKTRGASDGGGRRPRNYMAIRYNIPSFGHGGIDYVYLSLGTSTEPGKSCE